MTRHKLLAVSASGVAVVLVGLLFFGNLNRNLVYYVTPAEAIAQRAEVPDGRRMQLGGLVEPDSVVRTGEGLRFTVAGEATPGGPTVTVLHRGAPAQLFQSGIGVVLEGSWKGDRFVSDTMIVKHDEEYRPPDTEAAQ